MSQKVVTCIGAGYVGGPTMAFIADKCADYKVNVVDINKERIDRWNSDNLPIFEPGLDEVVFRARGRNLFFTTEVEKCINEAGIIFVCVNTPTKEFGLGAGVASNLEYIEKTARMIVANSNTPKIVVEKSTVPVKTAEALEKILNSNEKGLFFDVISNPEFLAEGTAVEDLKMPSRVLIGGHSTDSGKKAVEAVKAVYLNWVPEDRIVTTNVWSSELAKLASNAMLAQRVSSVNALAEFCEKAGADIEEVSKVIGMDPRIGSKFLKAGPGFGGSCFKKDVLNLVYLCRHFGANEAAEYWEHVVTINEYQRERLVRRMLSSMFNTVSNKKIAVLGFAFKADTGDTRESSAISVCKHLHIERAKITISDPQALENAKKELNDIKSDIIFEKDPYEACKNAHALVILTEWDEYKTLDYSKIFESMEKPAFIFDSRNILDHVVLNKIGFNVYASGKKELRNF